jgi:hypothetical protein
MDSLYRTERLKEGDTLVNRKAIQLTPPTLFQPQVNLHTVLKAGYGDKAKQQQFAVQHGYIRDPNSNDNQQIYYHPQSKSLLVNVTGTHNLSDIGTDLALAGGKLQNTQRFKEAKAAINQAKQTYKPLNTTLTGHSLGGGIISQGASKGDKVIALDPALTLGQKINPAHTLYRSSGDVVSIFGSGDINTIQGKQSLIPTLGIVQNIKKSIEAHKVDNIKDKNLFI